MEAFAKGVKAGDVGLFVKLFNNVFNMVHVRWVGCGEVKRVGGMSVNVYGAMTVHEGTECEDEEGNVGALATFVDVKPSDVIVVVDVVRDEKCSLKDVENVFGRGGCKGSLCVDVVLVDLIEQNL